jgi:hypothetical protein
MLEVRELYRRVVGKAEEKRLLGRPRLKIIILKLNLT